MRVNCCQSEQQLKIVCFSLHVNGINSEYDLLTLHTHTNSTIAIHYSIRISEMHVRANHKCKFNSTFLVCTMYTQKCVTFALMETKKRQYANADDIECERFAIVK